MKTLVVNAGSSSLKWQLYTTESEEVIAKGIYERVGIDGVYTIEVGEDKESNEYKLDSHLIAVEHMLAKLIEKNVISSVSEIAGIGHRVVQGGAKYVYPILISEEVEKGIEDLAKLAPLHNPGALQAIRAFKALIQVPNVAVFDTGFHQTMPKEKYIYPVPYSWYEDYSVRRYGFHGISHQYITQQYAEMENNPTPNLIICHIGNGASITAIKDGQSFNTTMGLTPLDGLMMGTRSGAVDPGIIEYMSEQLGKDASQIVTMLNKNSGILGFLGDSSDMRDLTSRVESGDEIAMLAFEIYTQKIADYVSMFYTQLGGKVDALVFTAGVGENARMVRTSVVDKIAALGYKLDEEANAQNATNLSSEGNTILRIPTNEELMILREFKKIVNK
jgi:acetate kinase